MWLRLGLISFEQQLIIEDIDIYSFRSIESLWQCESLVNDVTLYYYLARISFSVRLKCLSICLFAYTSIQC
jgi:hypothetical protein